MFSAKGFSPAQSGLLAKQNALHLQKSRMMHFVGHQFVGMKKLACVNGVGMFGGRSVTPKVVCQALEDKSEGVPEPDLEESQRQMERNYENCLLAIRFAVASAEKRLQDAKEAFEAAKGKESAAGDQNILKKKAEECDSDNKEAFEVAKGNENSAGDLELLKKKVRECENEVQALKTWYRIECGKGII